jgi:hypothetical protein
MDNIAHDDTGPEAMPLDFDADFMLKSDHCSRSLQISHTAVLLASQTAVFRFQGGGHNRPAPHEMLNLRAESGALQLTRAAAPLWPWLDR